MIIEAKEWLRMNGDYNINISLNGLYGCYSINATHNEIIIIRRLGMNLDKHLSDVLECLKEHEQNDKTNKLQMSNTPRSKSQGL